MSRRSARPVHGLTLLELSITMAITAVLGLASVPSLSSWVDRHRVRAAAQDLAADLGEARLEAARLARPVHVVFQPGESWCYAVALSAGVDCRHPDGRALKIVRSTQYPGVAMLDAAPQVFDGRDLPAVGNGGFSRLASARGEQVQVRVSALGRPAICAPETTARDLARC